MSDHINPDPRRRLASVSALPELPRVQDLISRYSRPQALDALRETLDAVRADHYIHAMRARAATARPQSSAASSLNPMTIPRANLLLSAKAQETS